MTEATLLETDQYLTFMLADEVFALDIATVREVLELSTITKVPRTPPFMRGVINLRGHAVPVVDMRIKFDMERAEDTVNTCIIIVEVRIDDEQVIMGAVADSVREVVEMGQDQIDPAPRMGSAINAEFIKGMGKQDDSFIIILDINKVFSLSELQMVMGDHPLPESRAEEAKEPAQA